MAWDGKRKDMALSSFPESKSEGGPRLKGLVSQLVSADPVPSSLLCHRGPGERGYL
jgi:hypothetical protein